MKKSIENGANEPKPGAAGDAAMAGGSPGDGGDPSKASEDSSTNLPDPSIPDAGSVADMIEHAAEAQAGFDPLIHAVNPDGTPKRKVDGSYALKRGRKAGMATASGPVLAQAADVATINTDEAARQSCNMLINGAVLLLGEQWEPRDKEEAKGLQTSFKNYFDARGVPNVPPEVGLAVAMLAYSLPRLTHEKTKSRFSTIKIRMFEIWSAIKGK